MANTNKTDISPAIPTELRHHRELPEGSYNIILSDYRKSLCLIKRMDDGTLYLIDWKGKGTMLKQFEVLPDDSLEYDDPNDRLDP